MLKINNFQHVFSDLHKNLGNHKVVSHEELTGILSDFKHSVIGSVRVSMLDAMKQQRKDKMRRKQTPSPQEADPDYNPMVDSDSSEEEQDLQEYPSYSSSEVEEW